MKNLEPGFPGESLYTLADERRAVCISAVGAAVVRVCLDGVDIALPMPRDDAFRAGTYAGCTVGPVAGRIAGGVLRVGDAVYCLAQNDGQNTLHGGPDNMSGREWRVEEHCEGHVALSCELADGENGFPGNRRFMVAYTLADGALRVEHTAVTDKPTVVSLTNHLYWNLSGCFSRLASGHTLQIPAESVWHNGPEHLPRTLAPVEGTAFDFNEPRPPETALERDATGQLANALGYNNAFVLSGAPAAVLLHTQSGRRLTVETDYPALVLYSGGYLGPAQRTAGGEELTPGCAYALEPQFAPDALPVLYPGERYCHSITFLLM